MIKLIACDLDNTLLNEQHEVYEEDSYLIQQIQESGIEFMVASGRSYEGAKSLIEPLGIQCDYVLLNGAIIVDKEGNLLQETPIKDTVLRQLVTMIRKEDVCFHMYSDQGTITFDALRGRREALNHVRSNGFSEEEALKIITQGHFGVYDKEYENEESFYNSNPKIYKVELFLSDFNLQTQIRQLLTNVNDIEVTNSVVDNIEITSCDAQKGIALRSYCKKKQIAKEEVLVFGDSLNDRNMMRVFPNSFAVENAVDEIMAVSNYITSSNIEHGVGKVLKEVLDAKGQDHFLKNFKKC